ncbi:c2h2 and c2hc zinc finger protein [Anaeramoeba flamelloides]|uniref:C2h2 and c2hc zinc finger protein n=1 Tax=Anaeramoeba flamelloides TaxID=1746091 RepID=A0ABQ8YSY6_9EUKA|nr:c2h2 and c2hc zinc finger protein [Anaeramoeba flamelloides]
MSNNFYCEICNLHFQTQIQLHQHQTKHLGTLEMKPQPQKHERLPSSEIEKSSSDSTNSQSNDSYQSNSEDLNWCEGKKEQEKLLTELRMALKTSEKNHNTSSDNEMNNLDQLAENIKKKFPNVPPVDFNQYFDRSWMELFTIMKNNNASDKLIDSLLHWINEFYKTKDPNQKQLPKTARTFIKVLKNNLPVNHYETWKSVFKKGFKTTEINSTLGYKQKKFQAKQNETIINISFFYDGHKSGKTSIDGLYMFVDNLQSCWRLKEPGIFLIANFPSNIKAYNVLDQLPLVSDLKLLQNGLNFNGVIGKTYIHSIVGDTPAQLEARGRKSHRCLQNCATCTLTMGQPEYQEDLTNVKRRKPNETKIYQNEFKKFVQTINDSKECRTLDKMESLTGVKTQLANIWINDFGFESSSFSQFPICWFHLLLEGLGKDIFQQVTSNLNSRQLKIAQKRWKKLKLPPLINKIQKPFTTKHLSAIDRQSLFQLAPLCLWDLIDLKYLKFFQIFIDILKNLYLPSRKEKNEKELEKLVIDLKNSFIDCYSKPTEKKSNLHYLLHLPESVRLSGGISTMYFALERYHQRFKTIHGHICLKDKKLLPFFSSKESIIKYIEYSNLEKRKHTQAFKKKKY